MDIKLPRVTKFSELGGMASDYLDSIISGKNEEIELCIALSGNGHYLTIAGRLHGTRKLVRRPPTISAIETAKKINELLLICGVSPDQIGHAELLSFQKTLYERHALEFFLGGEMDGSKALMGTNHSLLVAVFTQFDPRMVTE